MLIIRRYLPPTLPSPTKLIAASLSVVYLLTNCILCHAAESNIWADRQKQLAMLPAPLSSFPNVSIGNSTSALGSGGQARLLAGRSFSEGRDSRFRGNDGLALPLQYGNVRKILKPKSQASNAQSIIHIQDIHMNAEAQKNIGAAVSELVKRKKVDVVALEGGFGPIDLTAFQNFPHQDAVKKVADEMLTENKIPGPIHTLLTTPTPVRIVGVDDPKHYFANVDAYKQSALRQKKMKAELADSKKELEEKKRDLFNPQLAAFDSKVQAYREGKMALGDFLQVLGKPHPWPLPVGEGNHVGKFLAALELEQSLNFAQVESERARLLSKLVRTMSPEKTAALVEVSNSYRAGAISHMGFYEYLKNLCGDCGTDLKDYPAMDKYIRYVLLAEQIDSDQLFAEMKSLEESGYTQLARTDEERALIQESNRLSLTEKLVDFALTREEWSEYQSLKSRSLSPAGRGQVWGSFEDFYRQAEFRDEAMAKNLRDVLSSEKLEIRSNHSLLNTQNAVVLVTGGFHSQGIDQRLVDAGYTVITFVPKITKVDTENGSAYLGVFAQEKTPLEKLFEGQKLFLAEQAFSNPTRANAAFRIGHRAGLGKNFKTAVAGLLAGTGLMLVGCFAFLGKQYCLAKLDEHKWAIVIVGAGVASVFVIWNFLAIKKLFSGSQPGSTPEVKSGADSEKPVPVQNNSSPPVVQFSMQVPKKDFEGKVGEFGDLVKKLDLSQSPYSLSPDEIDLLNRRIDLLRSERVAELVVRGNRSTTGDFVGVLYAYLGIKPVSLISLNNWTPEVQEFSEICAKLESSFKIIPRGGRIYFVNENPLRTLDPRYWKKEKFSEYPQLAQAAVNLGVNKTRKPRYEDILASVPENFENHAALEGLCLGFGIDAVIAYQEKSSTGIDVLDVFPLSREQKESMVGVVRWSIREFYNSRHFHGAVPLHLNFLPNYVLPLDLGNAHTQLLATVASYAVARYDRDVFLSFAYTGIARGVRPPASLKSGEISEDIVDAILTTIDSPMGNEIRADLRNPVKPQQITIPSVVPPFLTEQLRRQVAERVKSLVEGGLHTISAGKAHAALTTEQVVELGIFEIEHGMLPAIDTIEVLKLVRERHPSAPIAFLLEDNLELAEEAIAAGADVLLGHNWTNEQVQALKQYPVLTVGIVDSTDPRGPDQALEETLAAGLDGVMLKRYSSWIPQLPEIIEAHKDLLIFVAGGVLPSASLAKISGAIPDAASLTDILTQFPSLILAVGIGAKNDDVAANKANILAVEEEVRSVRASQSATWLRYDWWKLGFAWWAEYVVSGGLGIGLAMLTQHALDGVLPSFVVGFIALAMGAVSTYGSFRYFHFFFMREHMNSPPVKRLALTYAITTAFILLGLINAIFFVPVALLLAIETEFHFNLNVGGADGVPAGVSMDRRRILSFPFAAAALGVARAVSAQDAMDEYNSLVTQLERLAKAEEEDMTPYRWEERAAKIADRMDEIMDGLNLTTAQQSRLAVVLRNVVLTGEKLKIPYIIYHQPVMGYYEPYHIVPKMLKHFNDAGFPAIEKEFLNNENPLVKIHGLLGVARRYEGNRDQFEKCRKIFEPFLTHEERDVRQVAAHVLIEVGGELSLPVLIGTPDSKIGMRDPEPGVRFRITSWYTYSIAAGKTKLDLPSVLISNPGIGISDPDTNTRRMTMFFIRRSFRERKTRPLSNPRPVLKALMETEGVGLSDPEESVVASTLSTIYAIDPKALKGKLLELVLSGSPEIREVAARMIADAGYEEDPADVLKALSQPERGLRDPDPRVRSELIYGLKEDDRMATLEFIDLFKTPGIGLNDKDERVVEAAASILARCYYRHPSLAGEEDILLVSRYLQQYPVMRNGLRLFRSLMDSDPDKSVVAVTLEKQRQRLNSGADLSIEGFNLLVSSLALEQVGIEQKIDLLENLYALAQGSKRSEEKYLRLIITAQNVDQFMQREKEAIERLPEETQEKIKGLASKLSALYATENIRPFDEIFGKDSNAILKLKLYAPLNPELYETLFTKNLKLKRTVLAKTNGVDTLIRFEGLVNGKRVLIEMDSSGDAHNYHGNVFESIHDRATHMVFYAGHTGFGASLALALSNAPTVNGFKIIGSLSCASAQAYAGKIATLIPGSHGVFTTTPSYGPSDSATLELIIRGATQPKTWSDIQEEVQMSALEFRPGDLQWTTAGKLVNQLKNKKLSDLLGLKKVTYDDTLKALNRVLDDPQFWSKAEEQFSPISLQDDSIRQLREKAEEKPEDMSPLDIRRLNRGILAALMPDGFAGDVDYLFPHEGDRRRQYVNLSENLQLTADYTFLPSSNFIYLEDHENFEVEFGNVDQTRIVSNKPRQTVQLMEYFIHYNDFLKENWGKLIPQGFSAADPEVFATMNIPAALEIQQSVEDEEKFDLRLNLGYRNQSQNVLVTMGLYELNAYFSKIKNKSDELTVMDTIRGLQLVAHYMKVHACEDLYPLFIQKHGLDVGKVPFDILVKTIPTDNPKDIEHRMRNLRILFRNLSPRQANPTEKDLKDSGLLSVIAALEFEPLSIAAMMKPAARPNSLLQSLVPSSIVYLWTGDKTWGTLGMVGEIVLMAGLIFFSMPSIITVPVILVLFVVHLPESVRSEKLDRAPPVLMRVLSHLLVFGSYLAAHFLHDSHPIFILVPVMIQLLVDLSVMWAPETVLQSPREGMTRRGFLGASAAAVVSLVANPLADAPAQNNDVSKLEALLGPLERLVKTSVESLETKEWKPRVEEKIKELQKFLDDNKPDEAEILRLAKILEEVVAVGDKRGWRNYEYWNFWDPPAEIASTLARIGEPAIPLIQQHFILKQEGDLKYIGIWALKDIADRDKETKAKIVGIFQGYLKDEKPRLRADAAAALMDLEPQESLKLLTETPDIGYRDPSSDVRRQLYWKLRRTVQFKKQEENIIPYFTTAEGVGVQDADIAMRIEAYDVLGGFIRVSKPSAEVRGELFRLLTQTPGVGTHDPDLRGVAECLMLLFAVDKEKFNEFVFQNDWGPHHPKVLIRRTIYMILAREDSIENGEGVLTALNKPGWGFHDPDVDVRTIIAAMVGNIVGDAIPQFINALTAEGVGIHDKDERVVIAAVGSLLRLFKKRPELIKPDLFKSFFKYMDRRSVFDRMDGLLDELPELKVFHDLAEQEAAQFAANPEHSVESINLMLFSFTVAAVPIESKVRAIKALYEFADKSTNKEERSYRLLVVMQALQMFLNTHEQEIENLPARTREELDDINKRLAPLISVDQLPYDEIFGPDNSKPLKMKIYAPLNPQLFIDLFAKRLGLKQTTIAKDQYRFEGVLNGKKILVLMDASGDPESYQGNVFESLSDKDTSFIVYSGHTGFGASLAFALGQTSQVVGTKTVMCLSCGSAQAYAGKITTHVPGSHGVFTTVPSYGPSDAATLEVVLRGATQRQDWEKMKEAAEMESYRFRRGEIFWTEGRLSKQLEDKEKRDLIGLTQITYDKTMDALNAALDDKTLLRRAQSLFRTKRAVREQLAELEVKFKDDLESITPLKLRRLNRAVLAAVYPNGFIETVDYLFPHEGNRRLKYVNYSGSEGSNLGIHFLPSSNIVLLENRDSFEYEYGNVDPSRIVSNKAREVVLKIDYFIHYNDFLKKYWSQLTSRGFFGSDQTHLLSVQSNSLNNGLGHDVALNLGYRNSSEAVLVMMGLYEFNAHFSKLKNGNNELTPVDVLRGLQLVAHYIKTHRRQDLYPQFLRKIGINSADVPLDTLLETVPTHDREDLKIRFESLKKLLEKLDPENKKAPAIDELEKAGLLSIVSTRTWDPVFDNIVLNDLSKERSLADAYVASSEKIAQLPVAATWLPYKWWKLGFAWWAEYLVSGGIGIGLSLLTHRTLDSILPEFVVGLAAIAVAMGATYSIFRYGHVFFMREHMNSPPVRRLAATYALSLALFSAVPFNPLLLLPAVALVFHETWFHFDLNFEGVEWKYIGTISIPVGEDLEINSDGSIGRKLKWLSIPVVFPVLAMTGLPAENPQSDKPALEAPKSPPDPIALFTDQFKDSEQAARISRGLQNHGIGSVTQLIERTEQELRSWDDLAADVDAVVDTLASFHLYLKPARQVRWPSLPQIVNGMDTSPAYRSLAINTLTKNKISNTDLPNLSFRDFAGIKKFGPGILVLFEQRLKGMGLRLRQLPGDIDLFLALLPIDRGQRGRVRTLFLDNGITNTTQLMARRQRSIAELRYANTFLRLAGNALEAIEQTREKYGLSHPDDVILEKPQFKSEAIHKGRQSTAFRSDPIAMLVDQISLERGSREDLRAALQNQKISSVTELLNNSEAELRAAPELAPYVDAIILLLRKVHLRLRPSGTSSLPLPSLEEFTSGLALTKTQRSMVTTRLREGGLSTLPALTQAIPQELLAVRGFGPTIVEAIEEGLAGLNQRLAQTPDTIDIFLGLIPVELSWQTRIGNIFREEGIDTTTELAQRRARKWMDSNHVAPAWNLSNRNIELVEQTRAKYGLLPYGTPTTTAQPQSNVSTEQASDADPETQRIMDMLSMGLRADFDAAFGRWNHLSEAELANIKRLANLPAEHELRNDSPDYLRTGQGEYRIGRGNQVIKTHGASLCMIVTVHIARPNPAENIGLITHMDSDNANSRLSYQQMLNSLRAAGVGAEEIKGARIRLFGDMETSRHSPVAANIRRGFREEWGVGIQPKNQSFTSILTQGARAIGLDVGNGESFDLANPNPIWGRNLIPANPNTNPTGTVSGSGTHTPLVEFSGPNVNPTPNSLAYYWALIRDKDHGTAVMKGKQGALVEIVLLNLIALVALFPLLDAVLTGGDPAVALGVGVLAMFVILALLALNHAQLHRRAYRTTYGHAIAQFFVSLFWFLPYLVPVLAGSTLFYLPLWIAIPIIAAAMFFAGQVHYTYDLWTMGIGPRTENADIYAVPDRYWENGLGTAVRFAAYFLYAGAMASGSLLIVEYAQNWFFLALFLVFGTLNFLLLVKSKVLITFKLSLLPIRVSVRSGFRVAERWWIWPILLIGVLAGFALLETSYALTDSYFQTSKWEGPWPAIGLAVIGGILIQNVVFLCLVWVVRAMDGITRWSRAGVPPGRFKWTVFSGLYLSLVLLASQAAHINPTWMLPAFAQATHDPEGGTVPFSVHGFTVGSTRFVVRARPEAPYDADDYAKLLEAQMLQLQGALAQDMKGKTVMVTVVDEVNKRPRLSDDFYTTHDGRMAHSQYYDGADRNGNLNQSSVYQMVVHEEIFMLDEPSILHYRLASRAWDRLPEAEEKLWRDWCATPGERGKKFDPRGLFILMYSQYTLADFYKFQSLAVNYFHLDWALINNITKQFVVDSKVPVRVDDTVQFVKIGTLEEVAQVVKDAAVFEHMRLLSIEERNHLYDEDKFIYYATQYLNLINVSHQGFTAETHPDRFHDELFPIMGAVYKHYGQTPTDRRVHLNWNWNEGMRINGVLVQRQNDETWESAVKKILSAIPKHRPGPTRMAGGNLLLVPAVVAQALVGQLGKESDVVLEAMPEAEVEENPAEPAVERPESFMTLNIVAIVLSLLGILGAGIHFKRKSQNRNQPPRTGGTIPGLYYWLTRTKLVPPQVARQVLIPIIESGTASVLQAISLVALIIWGEGREIVGGYLLLSLIIEGLFIWLHSLKVAPQPGEDAVLPHWPTVFLLALLHVVLPIPPLVIWIHQLLNTPAEEVSMGRRAFLRTVPAVGALVALGDRQARAEQNGKTGFESITPPISEPLLSDVKEVTVENIEKMVANWRELKEDGKLDDRQKMQVIYRIELDLEYGMYFVVASYQGRCVLMLGESHRRPLTLSVTRMLIEYLEKHPKETLVLRERANGEEKFKPTDEIDETTGHGILLSRAAEKERVSQVVTPGLLDKKIAEAVRGQRSHSEEELLRAYFLASYGDQVFPYVQVGRVPTGAFFRAVEFVSQELGRDPGEVALAILPIMKEVIKNPQSAMEQFNSTALDFSVIANELTVDGFKALLNKNPNQEVLIWKAGGAHTPFGRGDSLMIPPYFDFLVAAFTSEGVTETKIRNHYRLPPAPPSYAVPIVVGTVFGALISLVLFRAIRMKSMMEASDRAREKMATQMKDLIEGGLHTKTGGKGHAALTAQQVAELAGIEIEQGMMPAVDTIEILNLVRAKHPTAPVAFLCEDNFALAKKAAQRGASVLLGSGWSQPQVKALRIYPVLVISEVDSTDSRGPNHALRSTMDTGVDGVMLKRYSGWESQLAGILQTYSGRLIMVAGGIVPASSVGAVPNSTSITEVLTKFPDAIPAVGLNPSETDPQVFAARVLSIREEVNAVRNPGVKTDISKTLAAKYDDNGNALPFHGATTAAWIYPDRQAEIYQGLVKAQQQLIDLLTENGLADRFAMLPPSSFHITTFDLVTSQALGIDGPLPASKKAELVTKLEKAFARVKAERIPPIRYKFERLARKPAGIGVSVVPATPTDAQAAERFRQIMAEETGVTLPPFRPHVSFSYRFRDLSKSEEELADQIAASVDVVSIPVFTINEIEHRIFKSMEDYGDALETVKLTEDGQRTANQQYWETSGPKFERGKEHDTSLNKHLETLGTMLPSKESPVFDVGMGSGRSLRVLAAQGYFNLSGIDLSAENVEQARRQLPANDQQLIQGDFNDYQPTSSYDAVIASDVLLYLSPEEQLQALKKIAAMLNDNGVVLIRWAAGSGKIEVKTKTVGQDTLQTTVIHATPESLERLIGLAGLKLRRPIERETVTINSGTEFERQQDYLVAFAGKSSPETSSSGIKAHSSWAVVIPGLILAVYLYQGHGVPSWVMCALGVGVTILFGAKLWRLRSAPINKIIFKFSLLSLLLISLQGVSQVNGKLLLGILDMDPVVYWILFTGMTAVITGGLYLRNRISGTGPKHWQVWRQLSRGDKALIFLSATMVNFIGFFFFISAMHSTLPVHMYTLTMMVASVVRALLSGLIFGWWLNVEEEKGRSISKLGLAASSIGFLVVLFQSVADYEGGNLLVYLWNNGIVPTFLNMFTVTLGNLASRWLIGLKYQDSPLKKSLPSFMTDFHLFFGFVSALLATAGLAVSHQNGVDLGIFSTVGRQSFDFWLGGFRFAQLSPWDWGMLSFTALVFFWCSNLLYRIHHERRFPNSIFNVIHLVRPFITWVIAFVVSVLFVPGLGSSLQNWQIISGLFIAYGTWLIATRSEGASLPIRLKSKVNSLYAGLTEPQKASLQTVLAAVQAAETNAKGESTLSLQIGQMIEPNGLTPVQQQRFTIGFELLLNGSLKNIFESLRAALDKAFLIAGRAPVLVFINDDDLIPLREAFEKAKKQNESWWGRLVAALTGRRSFVMAVVSLSASRNSGLLQRVRNMQDTFSGAVLSAYTVSGQGFVQEKGQFHYEDMFESFYFKEAFRNEPAILALLGKLRMGNPRIGTRIIQVNQPSEVYAIDSSILELIIMLVPMPDGRTRIIDFRALLETSKNA